MCFEQKQPFSPALSKGLCCCFPGVTAVAACHVWPLPGQPQKLHEMRIKQAINPQPWAGHRSLSGFQFGCSPAGPRGWCSQRCYITPCLPRDLSVFPEFWAQDGSNLAVAIGPLSFCHRVESLQPLLEMFIYVLLCPERLSEVSLLSPAAPVKSRRQSVSPLHEGFLFLIKLACALPRGTC